MNNLIKENTENRKLRRDLDQQTVVVIGNGMVGHRFCENLVEAMLSSNTAS